MKYVSTRNNSIEFSFEQVFIKGLADDGGLFVPKSIKLLDSNDLDKLKSLNYNDLAFEILYPFCSDFINEEDLKIIIKKSYSTFRDKEVVRISDLENLKLLELYHGPTLAFKDIAMQFIGNLYDYYLSKKNDFLNVVVATSGDTGAAAIDAIKGKKNKLLPGICTKLAAPIPAHTAHYLPRPMLMAWSRVLPVCRQRTARTNYI